MSRFDRIDANMGIYVRSGLFETETEAAGVHLKHRVISFNCCRSRRMAACVSGGQLSVSSVVNYHWAKSRNGNECCAVLFQNGFVSVPTDFRSIFFLMKREELPTLATVFFFFLFSKR